MYTKEYAPIGKYVWHIGFVAIPSLALWAKVDLRMANMFRSFVRHQTNKG